MRSCNARTGRPLFNGALFILLAAATLPARAQTVEQTKEAETSETNARPAERALPTNEELTDESQPLEDEDGEVVRLSPFSVSGENESGYQAKRTIAGTRLSTDLNDIGSALQVVTQQFLRDTGATNNQSLLTLTTATEVGGQHGNYAGLGNGKILYESSTLMRPDLNTRIRGLAAADNTRDFERSDIPWDAYNIETVEIQRGPNSILFGEGSPGGLVNGSLKQAGFKNSGAVEARFGAHGSTRGTFNLNRVLLKDELAVRLDLLKDLAQYQQRPAFRDDKRIFTALRYDPKFLNQGSAHTTFRANYERGSVKATNPRYIPPYDQITPWFETGTETVNGKTYNNLNRQTFDFIYAGSYFPDIPGSGAQSTTSPNYQPKLSSMYSGNFAYFPDPNSAAQSGNYLAPSVYYTGQTYGLAPNGTIDARIDGLAQGGQALISSYSNAAITLGRQFAANYKDRTLNDPSVFDFYNNLIDGPMRRNDYDFEAFNLVLSQTFLENRLGIEAKYDRQRYDYVNYDPFGGGMYISVDVNQRLSDLSPNPNVGRPFIQTFSYYGGGAGETERDSKRATAFAELRGADVFRGRPRLADILGRQVFTASYNESSRYAEDRARATSAIANGGAGLDPHGLIGSELSQYRALQAISYVGPSLLNSTSLAGANFSRIGAVQIPYATHLTAFDSTWNHSRNPVDVGYVNPAAPWLNPFTNTTSTQSENPANYVGWTNLPVRTLTIQNGDASMLTTSAIKQLADTQSKVAVWQGFFFNGMIVPTLGYREDKSQAYRKVAAVTAGVTGDGVAQLNDPNYRLPDDPYNTIEGINRSYSVVVHTPMFIRKHLPLQSNFSVFINGSRNFRPDAERVDMLNNPLPKPTGKTKDYGVVASFFDGRLNFKITKFDVSAQHATYALGNAWLAGVLEGRAWGMAKRYLAGLSGDPRYTGPSYNYGTMVNGVFVQTDADRALQQQQAQAVLDNFYPELWEGWQMTANDDLWQNAPGLFFNGVLPPATGTSNTVSRGYEFEGYWKPTPNWDITFNAARVSATQEDILGQTVGEFIKARNEVWQGPAGQIRLYSGLSTDTVFNIWNQYVWQPFALAQLLNGSLSSEISRWRYNAVTGYRFTEGKLNGVNIGGAFSWQSKVSIGYPSIRADVAGVPSDTFDITRPFYGPDDSTVSLWAGYTRMIRSNIRWSLQLNVNNALGKDELIAVNAQPDGAPAAYRIKAGPTWTVTTRFAF